ncbi:HAD family hydrolase [Microtetraspora malaysiensis]|uniref:HAD family hydrolase n=1 Tax=Microtetraspora malaysiensis TaxID=161358 RepID=UPI003D924032
MSGHHPSYRIGYAKPDPRAFLAVAAAHGVSPEEIIHVGDSVEFDVRAALGVGARAVWLPAEPPHQAAADPPADADGCLHLVSTLPAVVDHVRDLLTGPTPTTPHAT